MTSSDCRPKKLDALTSLRFIAAAMIVIGHAHPLFGSLGIANSAPLSQGVSFFFVLSGFILAYNYPRLDGNKAVKQFLLARFARVWPLHGTMLLLWIAVIFNFDRQSRFPGVEGLLSLSTNALLLQAWVPLHMWSLSFNGVAWSLSVEFFFYAMFPFLIRSWSKTWHWQLLVQSTVVIVFITLCTVLALPSTDSHAGVGLLGLIYINPLVRLLEFSIGISTAFLVRKIANQQVVLSQSQWFVVELASVGSCVIALLAAANLSGIQQIFGTAAAYYFTREGLWLLYAALIGVFALSHGPISKFLSFRWMVFLGEISFALYLCHALVIHYLESYATPLRAAGGTAYLLFWLALLVLSAILFYGVEQPARKLILQTVESNRSTRVFANRSLIDWSIPALAFVALIAIAVSAVVFRPSMIERLEDTQAQRFLSMPGTHAIEGGATFDARYQILAFRATPIGDDKVALLLLMRAGQDVAANDVIALHLNDAQGTMFDSPGDVVIDKAAAITPAGTMWVQRFVTTRMQYDKTHSVGVAMYKDSTRLYKVVGGTADWNGLRLILPKVSLKSDTTYGPHP